MRINKQILKEAAKSLATKHRLQELAGVEQTGRASDYLPEEYQDMVVPQLITEKQETTYFCIKDSTIRNNDDGTISASACLTSATTCSPNPCGDGCTCKSVTSAPSSGAVSGEFGSDSLSLTDPTGHTPQISTDPRDPGDEDDSQFINEDVNMVFESCAKLISQSGILGQHLVFKTCEGNHCEACYKNGCGCVKTVKTDGTAGA